MRFVTLIVVAMLLSLGALAGPAAAATTASQLVELMKAGLSDDVLIALIQTDGSTFQLSANDILDLHRQGLSDKVILAMQQTARKPVPEPPPPASTPEATDPSQSDSFQQAVAPEIPQADVPQPAAVTVTPTATQQVEPSPPYATYPYLTPTVAVIGLPVAAPAVHRPVVTTPVAPIYWGWGGQRRPDSWDDGVRRDSAKTPVADKRKGG